jgi:PQQ-like domain
VLVTGLSAGSGTGDDYATVAYDATSGARQWVKRYNGSANGADDAYDLAVSPDGSKAFVTGRSAGSGSDYDYATIAYDAATGAKQWAKRYNGPGNGADVATSVATSPDGATLIVTGQSVGSGGSDDYATVSYDPATGARQWLKRYNGSASGDDDASALAFGPGSHRVFVTGRSAGSGSDFDYATVAYRAG